MIQKVFLVDALVDGPFSGAPTTVIYLSDPLERFKMASLAAEFGTTESVFLLPHGKSFLLRFFTPATEIKLGVHACQVAAHIVYELGFRPPNSPVTFLTQEGEVFCQHTAPDLTSIELDAQNSIDLPKEELDGFGAFLGLEPSNVSWGIRTPGNLMVLALTDPSLLKQLKPKLSEIMNAKLDVLAATALSNRMGESDYLLRSFRPTWEPCEEHVSGSINRALAPRWSKILKKKELVTRQLSKRGGLVTIEIPNPDRVILKGRAKTVLRADIILDTDSHFIP
ncbi:MAG: PhzF family phenazine biosynthesis protein [Deltaproteobacteria bacterium]|jgi:PhzF family phenazine biosynthesis protein|nr:PhzF family phenazine biosynthesis protein [Deltaproteobacteria bacterium]